MFTVRLREFRVASVSLGARVLLSALIILVSTPPYSTAKKRTSWGESKGDVGEGGGGWVGREKTKKLFLPFPPLSPSITLTPTPRVAISTLPSLTNKDNPLFWEKHAQKPRLASVHFVRGCPQLMPGNQCLGTGTKWCCVHSLSTRYVTVYKVTLFCPIRLHFETCA